MNDDILKLYKSIGSSSQENTAQQPAQLRFANTNQNTLSNVNVNPNEILQNSAKRNNDFPTENTSKRKREKCSKGLRHFSMKVCEKVKQKNVTSYNEVADELVQEYCNYSTEQSSLDYWSYDQKNVRRRVYDALNVLMAMNIISKEKKEIKWIGLPCNKKQECQELELEKQKKIESIQSKCEQLKELILEQIAFKSLIEKNKLRSQFEKTNKQQIKIKLPFIVVDTDKKTCIDCHISTDKKEYTFNFDNTFQLSNHVDMLKKLGLTMGLEKGTCQESDLQKASKMIPNTFLPYLKQMATSNALTPVLDLPDIPNYKNLLEMQSNENQMLTNFNDINDLNECTSMDEQGDYSMDSDESDSDDMSLNDSS